MDIDLLKSAPEDQIDMLMMMQMDHIGDYNSVISEMQQPMEFSNISTNKLGHVLQNSTTFVNLPSTTLSFTGSLPVQEPGELPFLSNSQMGRWRNNNGDGVANINHHEFPTQLEQKRNSMGAMREMIFRIAAMQPIHIDPESVKPPKRRNVKISKDPQSVAARHRRERISERIRILQRLVPGGTKMDTASMLDEAIHYVKFLKNQVQSLERAAVNRPVTTAGIEFPVPMCRGNFMAMQQGTTKGGYHQSSAQNQVQQYLDG